VSIVTPTFNSSPYLTSTVESVIGQTFADWEYVLIDDGSADETLVLAHDFATRDPRIRVATSTHGGGATARNRGLRRTDPRSEFVIFLDHDDTWEPHTLKTLVEALDANPDAVAAYGLARAIDGDGRRFEHDDLAESMRQRQELLNSRYVNLPVVAPTSFATMLVKNWVVTPGTCLVRRVALDAVGDLDPTTSPADDWDLNLRLARLGDLALVDRVVLNWRRHPSALSHTSRRLRWAYFMVRRRTVQSRDNTLRQRKTALELLLADCRAARGDVAADVSAHRFGHAVLASMYALLQYGVYCWYRLSLRRGWHV
jgi:glycosyltransferase involved in cell wall biosynthesis